MYTREDHRLVDDPVVCERLRQLMPEQRHLYLYFLIVGMLEGDVRWCDLRKLHRARPLHAPLDPPRNDTATFLLNILNGVLYAKFRRRQYFDLVRRTVVSHAYATRLPKELVARVEKTMRRLAAHEYPTPKALLPLPIAPE